MIRVIVCRKGLGKEFSPQSTTVVEIFVCLHPTKEVPEEFYKGIAKE